MSIPVSHTLYIRHWRGEGGRGQAGVRPPASAAGPWAAAAAPHLAKRVLYVVWKLPKIGDRAHEVHEGLQILLRALRRHGSAPPTMRPPHSPGPHCGAAVLPRTSCGLRSSAMRTSGGCRRIRFSTSGAGASAARVSVGINASGDGFPASYAGRRRTLGGSWSMRSELAERHITVVVVVHLLSHRLRQHFHQHCGKKQGQRGPESGPCGPRGGASCGKRAATHAQ